MNKRTGPYTAIVVGSGCSVGLDVPALAGFLDTVMDKLAKTSAYSGAKDDLAAIQAFITRIKGAAAYVNADLLNIEELYGMADMDEDLWKAAGRPRPEEWYGFKPLIPSLNPMRVKKAFNRAIYYLASRAGEEFLSQGDRFPETLRQLEEIKRESSTETPLHRNSGTRWTNLLAYLCLASFQDKNDAFPLFIQFNWDLALDRALCYWTRLRIKDENSVDPAWNRVRRYLKKCDKACTDEKIWLPWYGKQKNGTSRYRQWPHLARPHGGINWIDKDGYPLNGALNHDCFKLPDNKKNKVWVDTCPVFHQDFEESISWKYRGEYMGIVPPTWRKQATKPAYEAQWGHISQGLQSVRRIIFIGYSLPKTDLYFRHFLALSLADNPHLPKVYVLNPGIQEPGGVQDNYLDLFAPLAREGRLYGIQGRFGDPALFNLHRAIAIAKPVTHRKSG
jgi:hypothetical protein